MLQSLWNKIRSLLVVILVVMGVYTLSYFVLSQGLPFLFVGFDSGVLNWFGLCVLISLQSLILVGIAIVANYYVVKLGLNRKKILLVALCIPVIVVLAALVIAYFLLTDSMLAHLMSLSMSQMLYGGGIMLSILLFSIEGYGLIFGTLHVFMNRSSYLQKKNPQN